MPLPSVKGQGHLGSGAGRCCTSGGLLHSEDLTHSTGASHISCHHQRDRASVSEMLLAVGSGQGAADIGQTWARAPRKQQLAHILRRQGGWTGTAHSDAAQERGPPGPCSQATLASPGLLPGDKRKLQCLAGHGRHGHCPARHPVVLGAKRQGASRCHGVPPPFLWAAVPSGTLPAAASSSTAPVSAWQGGFRVARN